MKTTAHVERLLRQGKKPKELLALGFPKRVVTMVRRRLREEKSSQVAKLAKGGRRAKSHLLSSDPEESRHATVPRPAASDREFNELTRRVELLEGKAVGIATLKNWQEALDATPALGLKNHFQCDCGASGFVALHIQSPSVGEKPGGAGFRSGNSWLAPRAVGSGVGAVAAAGGRQ